MQNISALLQLFSVNFARRIGHGLLVFLILLNLFPALQARAEITTTEINGTTGTEAINSRAQAGTTNSQGVLGFTECNYGGNRTVSRDASQFQECLKQVLRFTFVVGLFLIAIRIAMEAFASLNPFVSGQAAQRSVELVRDVVIGLVFIGAPVIFISLFNPAALNLNFLDLSFVPGSDRNPNAGTNPDGSAAGTDTNGNGVIDPNEENGGGTGGGETGTGGGIGTGGGAGGSGSGTGTGGSGTGSSGGGSVPVGDGSVRVGLDENGNPTITYNGDEIPMGTLGDRIVELGKEGIENPLAEEQLKKVGDMLNQAKNGPTNGLNSEQAARDAQRQAELEQTKKSGGLTPAQQAELDKIVQNKEAAAKAQEIYGKAVGSTAFNELLKKYESNSILSETGQTEWDKCFRLEQIELKNCTLKGVYFAVPHLFGDKLTPNSGNQGQPVYSIRIYPKGTDGPSSLPNNSISYRLEGSGCENSPFLKTPDNITGNLDTPNCKIHLIGISNIARAYEQNFYQ